MIMTTDGTTDPPNFNLVADISYGSISLVCFLVETDEESLGSKIPWVREVLWVTSEESLGSEDQDSLGSNKSIESKEFARS